MEDIKLHTAQEAASLLRVSLQTVYNLVNRHELAAVRIGRRVGIMEADLQEFIKKNRQPAIFELQSTHGGTPSRA